MSGILEHCTVLYGFASRYAQLQQSLPHVQPPEGEVAEMARRANEVVRLLEELRRLNASSSTGSAPAPASFSTNSHPMPYPASSYGAGAVNGLGLGLGLGRTTAIEPMEVDSVGVGPGPDGVRAPKRPWEEMNGGGDDGEEVDGDEVDELEDPEQPQPYPTPTDIKPSPPNSLRGPSALPAPNSSNSTGSGSGSSGGGPPQTTAEQDMELIRTKRASTTAGGAGGVSAGQPKSKYRKRSSGQRATPPGKCHSCHIRETPEWRRGPDGARTLCNACGLHYAKLIRKRDKEHGANGAAPQIDMDTLRASARADIAEKSGSRGNKAAAAAAPSAEPPPPPPPPAPPAHHEGSFQLTLSASLSPSEVQAQMQHAPPPPPQSAASVWATGGVQRAYAPEQLQHQSFLRTPQLVGGGQASPR
ncbi:hypothetical protein C8R47DRAFT_1100181 [Mycena vitilis]|nr:hypothetical protein C8R47DRAFT_1100181 [Mycena vitilis]